MKVLVDGERRELNYVDENGINWVKDFIGNYGALSDGQFEWSEEDDAFIASQETFDWWKEVIAAQQALDKRITELKKLYDSEKVDAVVNAAADCDLEDLASSINKALDEEFDNTGK